MNKNLQFECSVSIPLATVDEGGEIVSEETVNFHAGEPFAGELIDEGDIYTIVFEDGRVATEIQKQSVSEVLPEGDLMLALRVTVPRVQEESILDYVARERAEMEAALASLQEDEIQLGKQESDEEYAELKSENQTQQPEQ